MPNDDDVKAFGCPVTFVYEQNYDVWQCAIMAFDETGHGGELAALLRGDETIPRPARELLTDLLDRRRIRDKDLPADTLPLLIRALLNKGELVPQAREFLERLFSHNLLAKKAGRPKAPLYERSVAEAKMLCAKLELQAAKLALKRKLTSKEREIIAQLHGTTLSALEVYVEGKPTGGIRRIRKRHRLKAEQNK
jgi:hypothetical protein